ncbi:MAG: hypothetical protein QNL35_07415 [Emcibacteraceae bacterium]|jgi:hypothetical protein
MKKFVAAMFLLATSSAVFAVEVASGEGGVYIIDGKKVYYCTQFCKLITNDYTQSK